MSKDTELNPSGEDQQVTLQDSATQAFDKLAGETTEKPEKALATPPEPEFEVPSWAKAWPEPSREALKALGTIQHNKGHLDPILKQIEETNRYVSTRDQEFANYRKTFDPIYSTLREIEPGLRLQGMDLQQGVTRLVETAKFVESNPDEAIPYLARAYPVRDPVRLVQEIASQYGVDLGQIAQEAPYVDPAIQSLLAPLQQKLAQFEQMTAEQQQAAQRQQQEQQAQIQQAIVEKLASLEQQKDESGNLRFPHLAQVFDDIALLAQTGRYKTIEEAYDRAVLMNPELSQSVVQSAEQRAIQEAQRKSEAAKKEAQANRNVGGKGQKTSDAQKGRTLQDAATLAYAKVYGDD